MENLVNEIIPRKKANLKVMYTMMENQFEQDTYATEKRIERKVRKDENLASLDNSFKRHTKLKPSKFKGHYFYSAARSRMSMLRETVLNINIKRLSSPLRKRNSTFRTKTVYCAHRTANSRQYHFDSGGSSSGGDSSGGDSSDGGSDCPPWPNCFPIHVTPLHSVLLQRNNTFNHLASTVPSSAFGGEAA